MTNRTTSVDLNKLRDKLKNQRPVGVDQGGKVKMTDPRNDGSRSGNTGTTLKPQPFYTPAG